LSIDEQEELDNRWD